MKSIRLFCSAAFTFRSCEQRTEWTVKSIVCTVLPWNDDCAFPITFYMNSFSKENKSMSIRIASRLCVNVMLPNKQFSKNVYFYRIYYSLRWSFRTKTPQSETNYARVPSSFLTLTDILDKKKSVISGTGGLSPFSQTLLILEESLWPALERYDPTLPIEASNICNFPLKPQQM